MYQTTYKNGEFDGPFKQWNYVNGVVRQWYFYWINAQKQSHKLTITNTLKISLLDYYNIKYLKFLQVNKLSNIETAEYLDWKVCLYLIVFIMRGWLSKLEYFAGCPVLGLTKCLGPSQLYEKSLGGWDSVSCVKGKY